MLAKWKEKEPGLENCDHGLNMVMKHCVSRNLYFNCPGKVSSDKCTELDTFGKSCPVFPTVGGGFTGKKPAAKKKETDDE